MFLRTSGAQRSVAFPEFWASFQHKLKLRHSPILILKITYLNFTTVWFLFLIILRFVKPFSFISSQLINIVLIAVHYVSLVGRLYR